MNPKTNLALDITILIVFLIVANPSLTGNTIHEWLALSFAAAIVTHLLFHWKWLVSVTKDFFKKLLHQSRLNYIVDALFFITMTGTVLSGLLISKDITSAVGLHLDVSRSWKTIHTISADAVVILLGIHFALHLKWMLNAIGRYTIKPIRKLLHTPASRRLANHPVRIEEGN